MSAFWVGQKVVCVDATSVHDANGRYHESELMKGAVYTIRTVSAPHKFYSVERGATTGTGIRLVGVQKIRPNDMETSEDGYYCSRRFKPVEFQCIKDMIAEIMKLPADTKVDA